MNDANLKRRPAHELMSVEHAAAMLPDALSFPRAVMRELVSGRYRIHKLRFELDCAGRGEILYQLLGAGRVFHFFLVSDLLPESSKMDRNFAQGWDAMGVLCEGPWTKEREAWLRREVPKQRAGFADYGTLMYARGNRSGRIFDHVVDSLANGRQPDLKVLAPVGYILRTTAFIGNGQLGTRPLAGYDADHPLRLPYYAQFCSAFMLREYVFDLVDHLAKVRSKDAVRLAPAYRRFLGLGNSAATGLAAYSANHPHQMQQWSMVHEEVLVAAVNRTPVLSGERAERFESLLNKAIRYFSEGARADDRVFATPQETSAELAALTKEIRRMQSERIVCSDEKTFSLVDLLHWARTNVSAEAGEVLNSVIVEINPDLVEAAKYRFHVDEAASLVPEQRLADFLDILDRNFSWALAPDEGEQIPAHFWYRCTSAPRDVRRGFRGRLPHLEFETSMDFAWQLQELDRYLRSLPASRSLARALSGRPDLRYAAKRVQALRCSEYSVLRQQYLSSVYSPFESIRFVLTFYGVEKSEAAFPKSVRGTFMQGAPIAEDVALGRDGDWPFTLMPHPGNAGRADVLAPLPAGAGLSTELRAGAILPAMQEPSTWRIAPGELARMAQAALQGHGMPLGIAEEAAELVASSQASGEPAVSLLLEHCAGRRVAPITQFISEPAWPMGIDLVSFDAHHGSALAAASLATDMAIERCMGSANAIGACLVVGSPGSRLTKDLVVRCARRGLVAALLWRDVDTGQQPACGLAVAGPGPAGPWLGTGPSMPDAEPADARLAVLQQAVERMTGGGPAEFVDAVTRLLPASPPWALQKHPGFLLVCTRPPEQAGQDEYLAALENACAGATTWTDKSLSRYRRQWACEGVLVSRADYDALSAAGGALLVPQSIEHFVLNEGVDPVNTF